MVKVKMNVEGRVQGVGFRYMTKITADQLGIFGIVRNEYDGSVYIEANGSAEKISAFIDAIKKSPSPSGKVTFCGVDYDDNLPERTSFEVSY